MGYEIRYLPEEIGSTLTEEEIRSQPLVPVQCGRTIFRGDRYQMSLRFSSNPNGGSSALADPGKRSAKISVQTAQKDPGRQRAYHAKGASRSCAEGAGIGGAVGSSQKESAR